MSHCLHVGHGLYVGGSVSVYACMRACACVSVCACKHRDVQGVPRFFQASHSCFFKDRPLELSGFLPDIMRFRYMTLFLVADVQSLPCILFNKTA